MTEDQHWEKMREKRWANVNEEYLSMQLTLKIALAQRGWYEFPEPEEGLGTAIAHESDFETYIVGYITDKGIILDPGEDYAAIFAENYPTADAFVEAFKFEFNQLVKVWYPE